MRVRAIHIVQLSIMLFHNEDERSDGLNLGGVVMLMIPNVITMEYKEVGLFRCGVGDREHLLQCQCEVIINLEYYRYTHTLFLTGSCSSPLSHVLATMTVSKSDDVGASILLQ